MLRAPRTLSALAPIPVYTGLLIWLTWPLASHATTHLPRVCGNDALYEIWVLTWVSRALVRDPAGIFDPPVYVPSRHVLFYGPNGFGVLPYFAPVFLPTGNPVLAVNVTFFVCMTLAAWGLHRVTTYWSGSELAGFVAAWTLLTGPQWTFTLAAWPTSLAIHYVPWIAALAATSMRGIRAVTVMTGLVVLQSLANPVYVAPSVTAPVALIAVSQWLRRSTRASGTRLFAALILAGAVLSPMYAGYWAVRSQTLSQEARGPVHHQAQPPGDGRADAGRGFDFPLVLPWQRTFLAPVMQTSLVLIVIGGLIAALRSRSLDVRAKTGWRHAALWAAVGLFLAWPVIVLFGGLEVRTPLWALVAWLGLSPLQELAGLWRLDLSMVMGLALLAGLAFAASEPVVGRAPLARAALALVVVVAMYAELRVGMLREGFYERGDGDRGVSYVLREAPRPDTPLVRALEQGRGPVLELPENLISDAFVMFRSIYHRRPLVNGVSSYWPSGYLERRALAASLPDPTALSELRRVTGVTTIVVHPGARRWWAWERVAEHGGRSDVRLVARIEDSLLFEVTGRP
jgi:hypothetical protein